ALDEQADLLPLAQAGDAKAALVIGGHGRGPPRRVLPRRGGAELEPALKGPRPPPARHLGSPPLRPPPPRPPLPPRHLPRRPFTPASTGLVASPRITTGRTLAPGTGCPVRSINVPTMGSSGGIRSSSSGRPAKWRPHAGP